MMFVCVKVEYFGKFKERAGVAEEEIVLGEDIHNAHNSLRAYLKTKYSIEHRYMIILDNVHIQKALKENQQVLAGSVVKIVPYLSGG